MICFKVKSKLKFMKLKILDEIIKTNGNFRVLRVGVKSELVKDKIVIYSLITNLIC